MDAIHTSGVASLISGGEIFIYSCSVQLISFKTESISKEINCAVHECMNISPSLIEHLYMFRSLATKEGLEVPNCLPLKFSISIWKEVLHEVDIP